MARGGGPAPEPGAFVVGRVWSSCWPRPKPRWRRSRRKATTRRGESARRRAAQERAAQERRSRLAAALSEMSKLEESKARQPERKPAKKVEPRASTTDPEARRMRMSDGGFSPAYNVPIAADPPSRAIVGIDVTNQGTDHGADEPRRRPVERRTNGQVTEHLRDGGFVKRESIERAAEGGVMIYAPLRETGPDGAPCTHPPNDSPALAAWRARMASDAGRAVYRKRAATSATVNADLKTFRGRHAFTVRGLKQVRCVALWSALAYNIMRFAALLATCGCGDGDRPCRDEPVRPRKGVCPAGRKSAQLLRRSRRKCRTTRFS